MVGRHTGIAQGDYGQGCIPDGRLAAFQPAHVVFAHFKSVKTAEGFGHHRVIHRIPPQVQRQDGIHPRGLDAAPAAVGFLSLHYPPLGFAEGVAAEGGEGRGGHQLLIGEMQQAIEALERAAPCGQRERLSLSGRGVCAEFVDAEGQRTDGAVGAHDGERHDGLAGPAGEVVDIQRAPRRQQDHFGKQSGEIVPRPFAEERHPDAGEDSGALQAA